MYPRRVGRPAGSPSWRDPRGDLADRGVVGLELHDDLGLATPSATAVAPVSLVVGLSSRTWGDRREAGLRHRDHVPEEEPHLAGRRRDRLALGEQHAGRPAVGGRVEQGAELGGGLRPSSSMAGIRSPPPERAKARSPVAGDQVTDRPVLAGGARVAAPGPPGRATLVAGGEGVVPGGTLHGVGLEALGGGQEGVAGEELVGGGGQLGVLVGGPFTTGIERGR